MVGTFTARIENLEKGTIRQKQFDDLKSAKRWMKLHSRLTAKNNDICSIKREPDVDMLPRHSRRVYIAQIINIRFGTFIRREFDDLPSAKAWIVEKSNRNQPEDMPSIAIREVPLTGNRGRGGK